MHFKKLEIVGFKSFLNKTKLKFEPGVTAIVGPNGCGKSNVVDAIKWVLGEQSPKSMRGTAMQDVIFNGTEKHDPVNMAEVSLTLANEDRSLPVDYDEVTITRRLFRSGESEYLLNKTTVRLQDIRNVLLGTGIGTSLYSIVEQGRMDMIISSRPDDRRHIFEEASGITKFKMKKKEAMFRLDRTQENLQRRNDIIREVERQINSIERQARKAERYKVRFDELKDLEVRMSYKRYNEIGRDDASLLHEHEALKHAISDLSAETARASERLEALREEFSATMDEMQIAQAEIMKLSSEIDKNSHVEQVDRERIQELQKFVERLDFEIEQATERKDTMNVRLEGLDKKLVEVREGRKSKESELSAAEENAKDVSGKLESHKERLKDNREKTMDLLGRETRAKNALIRVSADIQNMQSRERRLRSDRQQTLSDKERAETELAGLTERLGAVGGELDSRKKEFDLFSDDYSAKQDRVRGLTSDRALKEKKLNEIRPRREFLEKLVNEREGLPESIKEIMRRLDENDGRFKGVHGVLSELVSVDFEYAGSVESVLGDISRALVVENREVAESVSAYLKEKNLPSACFAILDELKAILTEGKSGEIKKGTLDDVTQVIAAREPYSSAVEALLSGTFITVSSDAAKMLIGDAGFSGRIIGERGEVFSRGTHRSRDYSNNEAVSLFGRQEKIKQLKDEEEALVSAVKLGTEEINELEAWL
ncbi:MAG: AAA family ATPase, partial [Candidatus Omnitrophica bacterium]|nr:AAA family ATPase [Candidatus Omnitrophota bacterium]